MPCYSRRLGERVPGFNARAASTSQRAGLCRNARSRTTGRFQFFRTRPYQLSGGSQANLVDNAAMVYITTNALFALAISAKIFYFVISNKGGSPMPHQCNTRAATAPAGWPKGSIARQGFGKRSRVLLR